jgi:hypothetical protein
MVKIIHRFPCVAPSIAWEIGAARAAVKGAHIGVMTHLKNNEAPANDRGCVADGAMSPECRTL